ncbi:hypothetical protein EDB92DRAFT_202822 [Lactarius akahatsu]|uniref:Uncharacterized protein n=1 Tax=Lactarius akahatsu TaxID=416441 RepID=A0AAD4LKN0_9AGAM|nr:hypothetical protein EDB92DRAFT_202822 [Lactarius akahatsu]
MGERVHFKRLPQGRGKNENTGVRTGVLRARPRQRALKLIGSTGRGGCIPSLRLRPVNSTKPIAPDTFKACHRRLECFLNQSPFTVTVFTDFPPFNPEGPRICLDLVSSPHSQFTDHVFRIFDRSVSSRLRRQDPDTSSKPSLPSMGQKPNRSRRKRDLLVPSCPSNDESSAVVNHTAFPIEHRSPSDRASADESQISFAVLSC